MKDRLKKLWNDHPREILTIAYFGSLAGLTGYSIYKIVSGKDIVSVNVWNSKKDGYAEAVIKLRNGFSVVVPLKEAGNAQVIN